MWHRLQPWNKLRREVGLRSTLRWFLVRIGKRLGTRGPAKWRIRPPQARYALIARLRGSSDVSAFRQIFVRDHYAGLRDLKNVSLVLDLGANVGFSSAYFLSCFPESRVVAVEPDERNVAVCRANLKPFGKRATVLHGAVWSDGTRLCLSTGTFGDEREWAMQVVPPADGSAGDVQAWDMGSLIAMAGGGEVDLLKIDIERAELAVFDHRAKAWLPRIRNICIELHGRDCEEAFFRALSDFDYELQRSGELTICRNLRAKTRKTE